MEAARARAKAEASKACTTIVKRETEVNLEKAKLEAELHTLQHEKEVAAAAAEAEILESAAAELELDERRGDFVALPHESAEKRTSDYVDSVTHHSQLSSHKVHAFCPPLHHNPAQVRAPKPRSSPPNNAIHQPYSAEHTDMESHLRPSYQPAQGQTHSRSTEYQPPSPPSKKTVHPSRTTDDAGMSDIARYLVRRELVNSGLSKYDNHPENYWAWKASFISAIEGLRLTASEELDLLVKWLRAVHTADPITGLKMA